MNHEGKRVQAVFFVTEAGRRPVREWLKEELTTAQRKKVGKHIQVVEFGWPMGMPIVRKLEFDLWEVRAKLDAGIARVFFTIDDAEMILLHGIVKKSRKIPLQELEVARKRLALLKGN
ncbi:MAG: type II toxin-antitoxin system RelE/ParE family toxin [Planctomycetota bacterium]